MNTSDKFIETVLLILAIELWPCPENKGFNTRLNKNEEKGFSRVIKYEKDMMAPARNLLKWT